MRKTSFLLAAPILICATVTVLAGFKTEGYDLQIYAGAKLVGANWVRPQSPGRFIFSYSIYRIPREQTAQTPEGARVYAFQIVPSLEDDLVKVDVLALLEDPNTVSEEHPLHNFRKQSVGTYSLRIGELVEVSEMSKLGAQPLTLKIVK